MSVLQIHKVDNVGIFNYLHSEIRIDPWISCDQLSYFPDRAHLASVN